MRPALPEVYEEGPVTERNSCDFSALGSRNELWALCRAGMKQADYELTFFNTSFSLSDGSLPTHTLLTTPRSSTSTRVGVPDTSTSDSGDCLISSTLTPSPFR